MPTDQSHRRIGFGGLLAQDGAGKDGVELLRASQFDLNGQLVFRRPHGRHLTLLHHFADVQEGRQADAAGVKGHGQWTFHGQSQ